MNCYNDWASDFMDRAIDQVSGRIVEPKILTEENAWRKRYRYSWDSNVGGNYQIIYFWENSISGRRIDITKQEYQTQSQPTL